MKKPDLKQVLEELEPLTINDIDDVIILVQRAITSVMDDGDPFRHAGIIAEEMSTLENYFLKYDIYKNPSQKERKEFNRIKKKIIRYIRLSIKK